MPEFEGLLRLAGQSTPEIALTILGAIIVILSLRDRRSKDEPMVSVTERSQFKALKREIESLSERVNDNHRVVLDRIDRNHDRREREHDEIIALLRSFPRSAA